MSKESIIKIFKTFSGIISTMIVIACSIIYLMSDAWELKGVMIGLVLGVIVGSIIKIKFSIPRKYQHKDERDIIISLISSVISGCYFGISSFLAFVFVLTDIVQININEHSYTYTLVIIVAGTIIVDKISNKTLQQLF